MPHLHLSRNGQNKRHAKLTLNNFLEHNIFITPSQTKAIHRRSTLVYVGNSSSHHPVPPTTTN